MVRMKLAVGADSDPGKRKKRNEDSIFAASCTGNTSLSLLSCGLFVVAGGLGAYAHGQDASNSAIQAIVHSLFPKMVSGQTFQADACTAFLAEAVQCANEAVYQQNISLHSRERADVDVGVLTPLLLQWLLA